MDLGCHKDPIDSKMRGIVRRLFIEEVDVEVGSMASLLEKVHVGKIRKRRNQK